MECLHLSCLQFVVCYSSDYRILTSPLSIFWFAIGQMMEYLHLSCLKLGLLQARSWNTYISPAYSLVCYRSDDRILTFPLSIVWFGWHRTKGLFSQDRSDVNCKEIYQRDVNCKEIYQRDVNCKEIYQRNIRNYTVCLNKLFYTLKSLHFCINSYHSKYVAIKLSINIKLKNQLSE